MPAAPAKNSHQRFVPAPPSGLTLLSVLLYVAAFPRWDISGLAWFALAPFFAGIHGRDIKHAIHQSFWLGMGITLLGFPWVAYSLSQFGGLPLWLGVAGLVLFGFICQPQFWIAGPLYAWATGERRLKTPPLLLIVGGALFYAGLDWMLPKLFVDTLGHAFYRNDWIRQSADIGGPALLTFAAMVWNLLLADTLRLLRSNPGRTLATSLAPILRSLAAPLALATLLLFAVLGYGWHRQNQWSTLIDDCRNQKCHSIRAGVIQANIGDFEKVAAETGSYSAAERIVESYINLSRLSLADASGRPDFLIWPETAYPTLFGTPRTSKERRREEGIRDFVRSSEVPLVFGGYDRLQTKDFNSLWVLDEGDLSLLNPGREESARLGPGHLVYHKNQLLMFGETMPGSEYFPILDEWFPQVGNFGRGPGPEVLRLPRSGRDTGGPEGRSFAFAPIICYEALFTRYTRGGALQGADFFVNVTNDSWFGNLGEPELHLALTTFRSIETRLPQLRATNTGISALVLQDGSLARTGPSNEALHLNWDIPLISPPPTLVLRWGDWFGPLALLAGLIGIAYLALRPERRTHPRTSRN